MNSLDQYNSAKSQLVPGAIPERGLHFEFNEDDAMAPYYFMGRLVNAKAT